MKAIRCVLVMLALACLGSTAEATSRVQRVRVVQRVERVRVVQPVVVQRVRAVHAVQAVAVQKVVVAPVLAVGAYQYSAVVQPVQAFFTAPVVQPVVIGTSVAPVVQPVVMPPAR